MQVQSITSTGKYLQISKGAFYDFFRHFETFCFKICDTPLCISCVGTRNFLKHQKGPLHEFCVTRKFFDIFFVIPASIGYRNFRARQPANAKNFLKHLKFFRGKKFPHKKSDNPIYKVTINFQKNQWVRL